MSSHVNIDASASTHPSHLDKLVAEFFGAHKTNRSATVSSLPPYAPHGRNATETQPGASAEQEPRTLARMLFMYGFLFFPFWLVGISILFIPLSPTEDWESGKTDVEKSKLLHIHRKTEKKWARRCVIAMSSLTITAVLLAVIIKFGITGSV